MKHCPIIPEVEIIRGKRPLRGKIRPGEVFAWEPDFEYAREFAVVAKITDERIIWSWDMRYTKCVPNDESRFREACYRTTFNLFPVKEPPK